MVKLGVKVVDDPLKLATLWYPLWAFRACENAAGETVIWFAVTVICHGHCDVICNWNEPVAVWGAMPEVPEPEFNMGVKSA